VAAQRELTEVKADERDAFGKKVKALRRRGFIPARISQRDDRDVFIQMDEKLFVSAYKQAGSTGVLSISVGKQVLPTMVQRIERHPVRSEILHVDLVRVNLREPVTVDVPVALVGEAPAEKLTEGFLIRQTETLSVRGLPTELPRALEADLSSLNEIGDRILAQDILLPTGVELVSDPETLLVTIARPAVEVPEPVAEVEEEEEAAEEAEEREEEAAEEESEGEEKETDRSS
jgi:large subunit ribosomal protein L25